MPENLLITNLDPNNEKRWDELLLNSYNASYRLSLDFNHSTNNSYKNIKIYVFTKGEEDVAGAIYTLKSDPFGFIIVAEIKFGILFKTKEDLTYLPVIVEHFLHWANEMTASYVVFSPYFSMSFNGESTESYVLVNKVLDSYGFMPIKQGQHTYLIDLTQSENELLSRMNRSTRKLIKRGLKSEIKVEIKDTVNLELLNTFWKLYSSLSKMKKFGSITKDQFYQRVEGLINKKHSLLFITSCSNEIVNITMTSILGIPTGMYGAINPDFKNMNKCVSPGPVSNWAIFTELKKVGFKVYDMGYCPGRIPDKNHPNYNVWMYKYNFGPDHIQFMPTYGKMLKPLSGRLFKNIKYRN